MTGRSAGIFAIAIAIGCHDPVGSTGDGGTAPDPLATGTTTGPGDDGSTTETPPPPPDEPEPDLPPPDPPLPPDLGSGEVPEHMPPRFTEVTVEAGLGELDPGQLLIPPFCVLDSLLGPPESTGDYCLPERFLGAAAVGDFDGDQWPDVYLSRMDGPDWLLHNEGDGTFVDVAAEVGLTQVHLTGGVAWLDIEGDGDLDLMLTTIGDARNYLYVNDGTGHFSEEAQARGFALELGMVHVGTSIGVGDYDRDGYLDVFVADWHSSVALGEGPDYDRLLHNLGAADPGVFEDVTAAMGIDMQAVSVETGAPPGAWGFSPAFVDLDGDLWPELALASDYGASRLWHNDGLSGFTDVTTMAGVGTDHNGMGSAFGDYDGDGDLDWFVTAIDSPSLEDPGNRMYRNEGGMVFSDATDQLGVRAGGWGWGTAMVDGDLDGDLDLVMAAGFPGSAYGEDPVRLWVNNGEGPWPELALERGLDFHRQGRGLVAFDYDRDGDLDLLVHSNTETPGLFRNDVETGTWLELRAAGQGGNSRGIGAQVRLWVSPGDEPQLRHIGVGSHYLGHAEAAAYFGLGDGEAPVHRVELRWPATGETWVMQDLPRNQRVLAIE
ncbi:MAG: CRTAC1 family protein [Myxococcales bacterium]|nr:CRTAC1 family protein [Myxococcales bacterium]MCB9716742.1 CRTAC1 family protein [Myxococcales bacterium]